MITKLFKVIISASALLIGAAVPSTAQSLSDLDGNGFLFNPKTQQFLGNLSSDKFDSESICNQFGDYGSQFSDLSILNQFGDYGSRFSDLSAYNPRAEYPPVLVLSNGEPLAVVSVNSKWNGIHPGALFGVFCR